MYSNLDGRFINKKGVMMNDQSQRQITPVVQTNGEQVIPEFLLRKERKDGETEVFQSEDDVGTEDTTDVK